MNKCIFTEGSYSAYSIVRMLACSIESRPEPRSCRSVKIDLGGGGGEVGEEDGKDNPKLVHLEATGIMFTVTKLTPLR